MNKNPLTNISGIKQIHFLRNRISRLEKMQGDLLKTLDDLSRDKKQYRQFAELLPEIIFEIDPDYNVTFLNARAYRILDINRKKLETGMNVRELFAPDEREKVIAAIDNILKGKSQDQDLFTLTTRDGRNLELMVNAVAIKRNGKVSGMRGIAVDITEKSKIQYALSIESDLIQALLDTANFIIVCMDAEANILVFNDECERITGHKKSEVIGKKWHPIFVPEGLNWPSEYTFAEWVRLHPRDRYEKPILTKSGETRDILWSTSSIFGEEENQLIAIAVGFDITELKQAKAALVESEQKYQKLLEQSNDAIYLHLDGKLDFVNEKFVEMFGWQRNELFADDFDFMNLVAPESRESITRKLSGYFNSKTQPKRFEFIGLKKDGTRLNIEVSITHIRLEGRDITQGVYRDITRRKGFELMLKSAHSEMEQIFKASTPMIVIDKDFRILKINATYSELYKTPESEVIGKICHELYHGPLCGTSDCPMVKIFKGSDRYEYEDCTVLYDGTRIESIVTAMPFRSSDGEILGLVENYVDITARKDAEAALTDSRLRFKALFKASPIPTYAWSKKGDDFILKEYNHAASEITGGRIADLQGIKLSEMYSDRPDILQYVHRCYNEKSAFGISTRYVYKTIDKEQYLSVRITYAPPDTVLVHTEDITQRRLNKIRSAARLNLLQQLRTADTINRCLELGCAALYEAELFKRSVLTLHNEKREIINYGQIGIDPKVLKAAVKAPAPDMNTAAKMLQEKYRISNSYFIPEESGLDLQSEGRYIAPTEKIDEHGRAWRSRDELFAPIVNDNGRIIGWLSVDTPFDGKRPEKNTILYLEEFIDIVIKKVQSLDHLFALQKERTELYKKNVALNEVLAFIEEEKLNYKRQISDTVDQILLPTLGRVVNHDGAMNPVYYEMLKENLTNLKNSMGREIPVYSRLSAREAEICQMIRTGATSKEIAERLHVTVGTVQKHREKIRKKLGISNKDINLINYLKSL